MGEELVTTQQALVVDGNVGAAITAHAVASTQARYAIAQRFPRDLDTVRVKLLKECSRPGFAECAIYHKPIGKGIEGPSIRFVEAVIRTLGNIWPEVSAIYDDDDKRIVRVTVTDLESNTTYSKEITLRKAVERRSPDKAQVLSSRVNSKGDTVYLVRATDDDIQDREGALVSKAIRTLGLRLLPGDLLDEAMDRIYETRKAAVKADPEAARKRLVDAFAGIGVQPADLVGHLGHALSQMTEAEVDDLRKVYSTIKDGAAKWSDYAKPPAEESKTSKVAEALKNKG